MSKVAPPLKKRKDDLTAIALAGAQLDWEHRKIREKGEQRNIQKIIQALGSPLKRGKLSISTPSMGGIRHIPVVPTKLSKCSPQKTRQSIVS